MKVFNQESKNRPDEVVLLLNKKECMTLLSMLEFASASKQRKLTWKRMWNQLFNEVACW